MSNKNSGEMYVPPSEPTVIPPKDPAARGIIQFGIVTHLRPGEKGELIELPPSEPLSYAVQIACSKWGYTDPSVFALKFSGKPGYYVTEGSRKEMSGKIVHMHYSPLKVCSEIIEKLRESPSSSSSGGNPLLAGLEKLALRSSDPTVADVFVTNSGLDVLLEVIESDKLASPIFPGSYDIGLSYALTALLDILTNSPDSRWDTAQGGVLSKITSYVNSPKGNPQDRVALKSALQFLEAAVLSGPSLGQIEKEVALPNLVMHMTNPDREVQQSALSLLNAMMRKAEPQKQKQWASTLASKKYRSIILNNIIKRPGDRSSETNYQLYVLQTLLLNILDERRQTPVDPQDPDSLNRIKELCHVAFDSELGIITGGSTTDLTSTGKKEKPNLKREYKKLGFSNQINPSQDFAETPPGILALDCMHHLAKHREELYSKLVIECVYRGAGDDFLLPFARASIALTNVLCDILRIGEEPSDQQGRFFPFFFQHDKPFEELFCICARLVTKTWKEMRATTEDFDKVFDVVREQIRRTLDKLPDNLATFEAGIMSLTYAEITALRARERSSREEDELQAKPIQELRKKLIPEITALIKQNRINFLISGTRFSKFLPKGPVSAGVATLQKRTKEKFWFCRLSPNEKVFHYGDCDEKAIPLPEELPNKLKVVDIKELLTEKECPHIKDSKKPRNSHLAFSLVTERDPLQTVDFIAPDEKTFQLWNDGMHALLGEPMSSKEASTDLDILLHMELKLRLLDIEGITIPTEAPPIPPPPPPFDINKLIGTVK